jgi:dTDP-L-rhamnose 4-epimerase
VHEDGRQMRNFVHVRDVAHANVLALGHDLDRGLTAWNVASSTPRTVGDMAEALATAFGARRGDDTWPQLTGRYRPGDVRHVFASTERAAIELGFVSRVPFAEGMGEFAHAELRAPVVRSGR